MEIILMESIKGLGTIGSIVKVKDGFGRNFLLPQGKAVRASESNKAMIAANKADIETRNEQAKEQATIKSTQLEGNILDVIRQAGEDGRLFGSINPKELAKLISEKFTDIKYTQLIVKEPIKTIGLHEIHIALHSEVHSKFFINVARSESEAQDAKKIHSQKQEKPQEKPE